MTSSPLLRSAAAAVFVVAVGACGGDGDEPPPVTVPGATGAITDRVEVKEFRFEPENTTIRSGDTVTWVFVDDAAHSVAPKDPSSELRASEELQGGATYEFKFTKAGTVEYRCGIHNYMTGTVVVTP